ncbi:sigma-54-dependent Fis family transcriptional regulator [Alcaligenes endophyticus]|uniref:Sigma 54-interacting transcriptional regulator n=1 Tax=Alcaligenes endophyticus TaxID=1929088 RepID=A0ABT8EJ39_9BURK|nr:sigma 54-interacting transcriptional regulator [Alcaligenes endophyticus]MCX5591632.1 sigma 54-interacting transcriptional regulator [Alcaligenes endophyticus]MDN4121309.1 sigma 54-interacting transcriptional regulator [Alcaligenes endophyticus]
MVLDSAHHARRIRQIVEKGEYCPSDVSDVVLSSWRRCLEGYGLDPEQSQVPPVLTRAEFGERHERSAELLYEANQEMELLYHQLADEQLVVVLVDLDGTILHLVACAPLKTELHALNFCPGAIWSERFAGSNGMGTCLATGAPTLIRTTDHFYSEHTALTCAAVPIFDPQGELIAALNVTGRSGILPHSSMVLINLAARMIENRLMEASCSDALTVYFHMQAESVNVVYGGILMVSTQDGSIVALNRNALLLLGYQHASEVCGRAIESIFQLSFADLLQRSIEHSFQPMPVYSCGLGNRFFAVAQYSRKTLSHLVARGGQRFVPTYKQDLYGVSEPASPQRSRVESVVEFGDTEIQKSFQQALKVMRYQVPILLQGELGTGKERFARAVHQHSDRAEQAFVVLDCMLLGQAQPVSDIGVTEISVEVESSLARKVAQAAQGVLFLDKVQELSLPAQAQLLSLLDQQESVGDEQRVLLISSSSLSLLDKVAQGSFRADLYYRLSGLELNLKPLRERSHPANLFRALLCQEGCSQYLSPEAEARLLAYTWPGNVRQLSHVLRVMVAQKEDAAPFLEQHIPLHLLRMAGEPLVSSISMQPLVQAVPSTAIGGLPKEQVLGLNPLEQTERMTLLRFLEDNRWNISSVSKQLNMSRNTLYRRLHRLQIPLRTE